MNSLANIESHLWEAANILRGQVDAADFKADHAFAAEEKPIGILKREELLV
jgi:hypothetical protein